MTRRLLNLSLLVVLACGATPEPHVPPLTTALPAPLAEPASATVQVRVTHPARDRFHVEYTLPTASARLDLQRNPHGARDRWQPVHAKLVHEDGHDSIVAAEPRTRFEVDLPTDSFEPEKDYRNYYPFTDGGRLLYTGHLAATTLPGEITFVAGADESVAMHGQSPGPTVTAPMQVNGTYVYFGATKPVVTTDFVGVIDPGFPAAVRSDLDSLVPRLFQLYSEGLGRPAGAAEKPMLFATYTKRSGEDTNMGGGVMRPRVANFNFEFADGPTPKWILEQVDYIIAHESAHLWNADLYASDTAWITEGTADALAYRALKLLGRIDAEDYAAKVSSALSFCVTSLAEGESFAKAGRAGHYKELYLCGQTIAFLSEAAAKEPMMAFLQEVYAGPDNAYDENRYLEVLAKRDASTAAFVKRLVTDKLADPTAEFVKAFAHAGVPLEPSAKYDRAYSADVAAYAVRAIVEPRYVSTLQFAGDFGEVVSEKADGERFTSLAGVKFPAKGAEAWDAAIAQCKQDGFVRVGRKDKPEAKVPCARTPRARPQYLRITKLP